MSTVQGGVCTSSRHWNQFLREASETGGGPGLEAETAGKLADAPQAVSQMVSWDSLLPNP